ncbi:MAG: amino acid ABC transporter substrate-binding protein [Deltaproteobacteria bacterium]|nr:amino acid ABC transporter substrate-binding protein [Deltaproteobacteria bacterium]
MVIRILLCFFLLWIGVQSVGAQQTITVGVSLGLSGKYSVMGSMQKKGFKLWESHVNAKGGILGKKIQMQIYDDQSNPKQAKAIYSKMIEKDGVDLVFGPYSSGISGAVLPITEKHKYPVLLSGASSDRLWEKGYKYAFGVYTPASKYAVGFLQMMVKNKLKTVAIVSADDAFSVSLSEHTKKWANKFRLKVMLFERFKKGLKDLTQIASSVKTSRSQALVMCGHLNESVDMRRALKEIEWYPRAYYASVGPATQHFQTILGNDAELAFSSSQWEEAVGIHFPQGKTFIKSFNDVYGTSPSYHAATAYASGMILEAALKKVGSIDRDQLRKTLSAMDTMTVIGRYGVDRTGWQIRHFPLIVQWQEGKKKVVWPEKLKEAEPIIK